jgi:hypothetical protein
VRRCDESVGREGLKEESSGPISKASRDQVSGDLLQRRAPSLSKGRTVDETTLLRRRANEIQLSRCDIFPTGRVVSVLWGPGRRLAGSKWSLAAA